MRRDWNIICFQVLTTDGRVFVGSVTAVFFGITLPMRDYALAAVLAFELIWPTSLVFWKTNKQTNNLIYLFKQ